MSIKSKLMTACAGVVLAGVGASVANADLKIDLRLKDQADAKKVERALVDGEIFDIEVWAVVSGRQAGYSRTPIKDTKAPFKQIAWNYKFDYADGFQSLSGSVVTTPVAGGAVVADGTSTLYAGDAVPAFAALGASVGETVDLSGDGVMDLGAPNGTASDQANKYVNLRSGQMEYDPAAPGKGPTTLPPYVRPAQDPPTQEFLVGKLGFYVTAAIPGGIGVTEIRWALRRDASGQVEPNAALWEEDRLPAGATQESSPLNGASGVITLGAPIELGIIPEPMSMSVLGLGAALLGFRRSRR